MEVLKDFWALKFSGALCSDVQIKKKKGASQALYIAGGREKKSLPLTNSRSNAGRQIHISPLDEGDIKLSGVNGRAS